MWSWWMLPAALASVRNRETIASNCSPTISTPNSGRITFSATIRPIPRCLAR